MPPQKVHEEQTLRQDLQVKLLQSEQQLKQLKQSLGQPNGEFPDGTNPAVASEFSPSKTVCLVSKQYAYTDAASYTISIVHNRHMFGSSPL